MAQSTDLKNPDPLMRAVAKVRDKVGAPHVIFDDDSYISDLEDTGNNVFRAAAVRLLAIANSDAYIQKVQKTLELETDGAKLADSYRATAKTLLSMAEAALPENDALVPQGKCIGSHRVDGYTPRYYVD